MAKKPTKPDTGDVRTSTIFALKGTDVWKEWLDGLAKANHAPVTVTIEQALADLAAKLGYPGPPSRY